MILYRTDSGPVVLHGERYVYIQRPWIELVNDDQLHQRLEALCNARSASARVDKGTSQRRIEPLAPIGDQELWASGVTYERSRQARKEESASAGGGDFYDRVYASERPEIFLKATPHRVVGTGVAMHLRSDSRWMVPEPELVLVITRDRRIVGYTIGNDLSCRDIEGENPLYLPQAKIFDRCASIGPGILVSPIPPAPETAIRLKIHRNGKPVFEGETQLARLRRRLEELVEFLFRDNAHPNGVLLMTGTGIVPDDEFSLQPGDVVNISIDGIGTLSNPME